MKTFSATFPKTARGHAGTPVSRTVCILTFVLALLIQQPRLLAQTPTAAEADAALAEIKTQCNDRLRAFAALDKKTEEITSALANMDDLLAAAEKEAQKEPALATAATGLPPAEAIQQAKTARDSVKLNLDLAGKMQELAAQEQVLADKAASPAEKLDHYKKRLGYLENRAYHAHRAVEDYSQNRPGARAHNFNSEAFDKLKALAGVLAENNSASELGKLGQSFGGSRQRNEAALIPGNDPYFKSSANAYDKGTVTLPNGRKFDVSRLERAAAGSGNAPRQPLFRPVPAPDGTSYNLVDPAVYNRARRAAADPKVGGVALQATFLALSAAGVPGCQNDSYLEGVDQPVMLSLQRLLARVQPSASDPKRWASLPDELRFPGGIERIIGYVLDRDRSDVILIASPAQRTEARMDIDAIILGLRASWRDNETAYVSLDPSPLQPFGPQLSRVGGVPRDSIMAKIMLDADYMMKEIMLGKRQTDVETYKTVMQIVKTAPDPLSHPVHSRFWFYPKPLSPAVSSSARTVIFNAELQVLTEQMETQGATFLNTETAGDTEATAAFEFTRSLDAFSASGKTDPNALFARLRGLSGIVTLGALLRRTGIGYPVLKEFTSLPYHRLEGTQAAPRQYPGVVTDLDVRAQNGKIWRISIGGGVALVPRQRRTSRESAVDQLAAHFERKVDSGELRNKDAVRGPVPMAMPRLDPSSGNQRIDALLLKGSTAFRRGQFEAAAREFRAAADIDPASVDAYINLAFSFDRLGRNQEARAAIRTARLLEPEDEAAELIDFAISFRSEKTTLRLANQERTVRELIKLYTANAHHALNQHNSVQAYAWANDAIDLGLDQAATEAYLIRGEANLERAPEKAATDLGKAWEETRYVLTGGAYDRDEHIYVLACLGLAKCSLRQSQDALKNGVPGPALDRSIGAALTKSIDLLQPTQKLFPKLSGVFTSVLAYESARYSCLKDEYLPDYKKREEARLLALAEDLLNRFPDAADAHSSAGQMLLDLNQPERAIRACSRWLTGHPLDTDCLTLRAMAFALTGKCAEARQDLLNARKDPQFKGLPPEFKSPCGDL